MFIVLMGLTVGFIVLGLILGFIGQVKKKKNFIKYGLGSLLMAMVFLYMAMGYRKYLFKTLPIDYYNKGIKYESLDAREKNMIASFAYNVERLEGNSLDKALPAIIYYKMEITMGFNGNDYEAALEETKRYLDDNGVDYSKYMDVFNENNYK